MNLIRIASVLLWIALAMPAVAQQEAPPAPIPVGNGVMAANLITQVKPKYPESARSAGIYGKVFMTIVIDENGNVVETKLDWGPEELYEAASKAVMQWTYRPMRIDGKPVRVTTTVSVDFPYQPPRGHPKA